MRSKALARTCKENAAQDDSRPGTRRRREAEYGIHVPVPLGYEDLVYVERFLRPGLTWDCDVAMDVVLERLVAQLPGAAQQPVGPSTFAGGCLRRVIPLGGQHLRQIVAEYVEHYHLERNHQGLGNELIEAPPANSNGAGTIRCRERLGGTLRYYHRDAA